jgi:hypothetical protein
MEQAELLQTNIQDLQMGSLDALDLTLDLGELALADQAQESFDDLIRRARVVPGNLAPLRKCRHLLREGGKLRLQNPRPGADEPAYRELQEMLLRVAGFTDCVVSNDSSPLLVEATRRPGIVEEQDFGISVREIIDPAELARSHEFARDYYYYKDFNYDFEVASQFDLHTDTLGAYDKTGQMVALARCAVRVPGYNCPFMYAVAEDGAHYRVPARYRRAVEIMAIYKEGKVGVVAYKRLMEFLTQYAPHVAHADSVWTSFEANDPYTGNLYKNKFRMEDMGVRLTYRDFGGRWNLLCTDKIVELSVIHHNLFRS